MRTEYLSIAVPQPALHAPSKRRQIRKLMKRRGGPNWSEEAMGEPANSTAHPRAFK